MCAVLVCIVSHIASMCGPCVLFLCTACVISSSLTDSCSWISAAIPMTGLEPVISSLGGRRPVHWATQAMSSFSLFGRYSNSRGMETCRGSIPPSWRAWHFPGTSSLFGYQGRAPVNMLCAGRVCFCSVRPDVPALLTAGPRLAARLPRGSNLV